MEFIWSGTKEEQKGAYAEMEIWKALKALFINEEGICYHRYPVFSVDRSRREPDILMLHRDLGLYVIECKSCKIDNIERIEGASWVMKGWYSSRETPYTQGEDQMFSIINKFSTESKLRKGRYGIIQGHVFIALPFISSTEWKNKGLDLSPACPTTIIFSDDLEPMALKNRMQSVPAEEKQERITDDQWLIALGILQGVPVLKREIRPEGKKLNSKASMLRKVEEQTQSIDREQHKVAVQIPDGAQRIRGLAGSGKTVVMCMKAAWIHSRYPEWDIAYTFYTKSLYGQIQTNITRFYRWWADGDPDWTKIKILHGWGGKGVAGLYSSVSRQMNRTSRTFTEAQNVFTYKENNELLGNCCRELRDSSELVPELYDAILIDEAQDFHFDFYKLCLDLLRDPKRLIWAYDEVQSLESLNIPTTIDIFGTYSDGSPIVNLEGEYANGEIAKDVILYHCYRTPRPILVAAHIFGMGLLRSQGAVQFIPTREGWEEIGYEVISGDFTVGEKASIRRPEANSPNLLEKIAGVNNLIQCKSFSSVLDELDWVAQQIHKNINEDELKPEEIVVISLDPRRMRSNFDDLQVLLLNLGIKSVRVGRDTEEDVFKKPDHVTMTGIFRAKGNEASVVYVIGFEEVGSKYNPLVQSRNQAFTAMTRTRGWCVLTGVKSAEPLFQEINNILKNLENITFTVPDPKTIARNLDNLEYEKRRNKFKEMKETASKLLRTANTTDDVELAQKIAEIQELIQKKLKES